MSFRQPATFQAPPHMHSSPAPYCDPWELEAYSLLLFPEAQPTQADAVPSLRESEGFSGAPWPGASSEVKPVEEYVSSPNSILLQTLQRRDHFCFAPYTCLVDSEAQSTQPIF